MPSRQPMCVGNPNTMAFGINLGPDGVDWGFSSVDTYDSGSGGGEAPLSNSNPMAASSATTAMGFGGVSSLLSGGVLAAEGAVTRTATGTGSGVGGTASAAGSALSATAPNGTGSTVAHSEVTSTATGSNGAHGPSNSQTHAHPNIVVGAMRAQQYGANVPLIRGDAAISAAAAAVPAGEDDVNYLAFGASSSGTEEMASANFSATALPGGEGRDGDGDGPLGARLGHRGVGGVGETGDTLAIVAISAAVIEIPSPAGIIGRHAPHPLPSGPLSGRRAVSPASPQPPQAVAVAATATAETTATPITIVHNLAAESTSRSPAVGAIGEEKRLVGTSMLSSNATTIPTVSICDAAGGATADSGSVSAVNSETASGGPALSSSASVSVRAGRHRLPLMSASSPTGVDGDGPPSSDVGMAMGDDGEDEFEMILRGGSRSASSGGGGGTRTKRNSSVSLPSTDNPMNGAPSPIGAPFLVGASFASPFPTAGRRSAAATAAAATNGTTKYTATATGGGTGVSFVFVAPSADAAPPPSDAFGGSSAGGSAAGRSSGDNIDANGEGSPLCLRSGDSGGIVQPQITSSVACL